MPKIVIDEEGYLRGEDIHKLAKLVERALSNSAKSIAQLAVELNASPEAVERGINAARLLHRACIVRLRRGRYINEGQPIEHRMRGANDRRPEEV